MPEKDSGQLLNCQLVYKLVLLKIQVWFCLRFLSLFSYSKHLYFYILIFKNKLTFRQLP